MTVIGRGGAGWRRRPLELGWCENDAAAGARAQCDRGPMSSGWTLVVERTADSSEVEVRVRDPWFVAVLCAAAVGISVTSGAVVVKNAVSENGSNRVVLALISTVPFVFAVGLVVWYFFFKRVQRMLVSAREVTLWRRRNVETLDARAVRDVRAHRMDSGVWALVLRVSTKEGDRAVFIFQGMEQHELKEAVYAISSTLYLPDDQMKQGGGCGLLSDKVHYVSH